MKKIAELVCLMAVALFALNMDSQSKRNDSLEPAFAPLQEGQGSFRADIHDGGKKVSVKDISFFGVTSLGRIKSERDDSVSEFDLSEINQVDINNAHFDSKRFSDQVFTKITIQTRPLDNIEGKSVSELLIPRNIVVCGKEYETGLKRAWFISKIDKIVVHHNDYKPSEYPPGEHATKKKIKKKEQKAQVEIGPVVAASIDKAENKNNNERVVIDESSMNDDDQSEEESGVFATFQALIYALYDFIASIFSSIIGLFV